MTTRALPVIAVVAVVGLGLDLLIGYSPVVGYGAGIGLFGTIILTLVAKKAMAPVLQRGEDYYPADRTPDIEHDVYGVRTDGVRTDGDPGAADRTGGAGDQDHRNVPDPGGAA